MAQPKAPEALFYSLAQATNQIGVLFNQRLATLGLDLSTYLIIYYTGSTAAITQEWLAHRVTMNASTLTRRLQALETQGLILRIRHRQDRRSWRIQLTETGQACYDQLVPLLTGLNQRLREGLTDRQVTVLYASLQQIQLNAEHIAQET